MRTVTVTCDRCGAEARHRVSLVWGDPEAGVAPWDSAYDARAVDLCQRCADELRRWLEGRDEHGEQG